MKRLTVAAAAAEYLVDAHHKRAIDEEKNMITLTVIVAALALGHALIKAWNWAALAVAGKREARAVAQQAA